MFLYPKGRFFKGIQGLIDSPHVIEAISVEDLNVGYLRLIPAVLDSSITYCENILISLRQMHEPNLHSTSQQCDIFRCL